MVYTPKGQRSPCPYPSNDSINRYATGIELAVKISIYIIRFTIRTYIGGFDCVWDCISS